MSSFSFSLLSISDLNNSFCAFSFGELRFRLVPLAMEERLLEADPCIDVGVLLEGVLHARRLRADPTISVSSWLVKEISIAKIY